jgi:type II secretory ATPase GspE/PulE/Tfp pilus assembly ATPase PilB-like protein
MAYSPFLLPLLDKTPDGSDPIIVSTPAEEERHLNRSGAVCWDTMKKKVRNHYGLDFLIEFEDVRVGDIRKVSQGTLRGITLTDIDHDLFLIEHPEGISLADTHAREQCKVLLARPGLFLRLWRSAESQPNPTQVKANNAHSDQAEWIQETLSTMAARSGLSDWHLFPANGQYESRLRINGSLEYQPSLSSREGQSRIQAICAMADLETAPPTTVREGRLQLKIPSDVFEVRLSLVPTHFGTALTARFLSQSSASLPDWKSLGLTTVDRILLEGAFAKGEGLWLVCGPTGSGKSTTLHALLRKAVDCREKVLSIEDPVERLLPGVQQMQLDHPPGLTYALALKASLRQAPHTIMLGEIRDAETAAIAFQAARTGHRVLSTLHARNTAGLLRRLEDLGQNPEIVKQSQPTIIHQRLLPTLCQACRTPTRLHREWKDILINAGLDPPEIICVENGCAACTKGIRGRKPVFSVILRDVDTSSSQSLLKAAYPLLVNKEISPQTLLRFASPDERKALSSAALTPEMEPS